MCMTQTESTQKAQIEALLILAKGILGDNQIRIARRLGYDRDVFSRLKTEENYNGSPQLLAALGLLVELEELKIALRKPKSLEEQVEELRREVKALRVTTNLTEPSAAAFWRIGQAGMRRRLRRFYASRCK